MERAVFAGLAFIVNLPGNIRTAAVLGLVSGLAVFLRPEALMMDFLYGVATCVLFIRGWDYSMGLSIFGIITGSPPGIFFLRFC
jgi:hypothetical protein